MSRPLTTIVPASVASFPVSLAVCPVTGSVDTGSVDTGIAGTVGTGADTGCAPTGCGARLRGGLVLVSSFGEQNIVSREPAGLTSMNSPSATSPTDATLADPPVGTPTALEVNHKVDCLPADDSSRMIATSDSDNDSTVAMATFHPIQASATIVPCGPDRPGTSDEMAAAAD